MTSFSAVILAAGQGVRMRGTLPKVLYPIGGIPMIERILQSASALLPKDILIVCGHKQEKLKEALAHHHNINWVSQDQPLGTGHAVLQALPHLKQVDRVLILNGDVPLLSQTTLNHLLQCPGECALITNHVKNPHGLGRVVRDEKLKVQGIIEEKDATPVQKKITEICAGIYLFSKKLLDQFLPKITPHNAQNELYLTDIIKMAVQTGIEIQTVTPDHEYETLGINDKVQLAAVERIFQRSQAQQFMHQGLMLLDPNRFDLRGTLQFGEDVTVDVNVIMQGNIRLGNQVNIGPNVILKDCVIHDGAEILANSIIEGAIIGAGSHVGPFSRIRPETELDVNAKVGNFVEVKKSKIGAKSKVNHLSYIGDATIGREVNVGAGTITCNYDGKDKHPTWIGDHVSIGSDTQLIAPVKIGKGATIGAGTTVVRDVAENELIHNRVTHRSIIKTERTSD